MIKTKLPKINWLRILRIIIGISFIGEAIASKQWLFLFIGGFLLLQGILNVGCSNCETNPCEISNKSTH